MTWIILDSAQQTIIDEIEKQTDRGAALVASAFLEARLAGLIELRLHATPDKDIGTRVLGRDGILSAFSAKIDMAYMLQLYPRHVWQMLNIVRRIRNDFAHLETPIDFTEQTIADRSRSLEQIGFDKGVDSMHHWAAWLNLLIPPNPKLNHMQEIQKWLAAEGGGPWTIGAASSPRERFMNGIKFLLAFFAQMYPVVLRQRLVLRPPLPGKSAE